jgi:predicted nucleotidyltransferase
MTSLSEQLQSLANHCRIAELYVFGSRATEIVGRVRGQAVIPEYPDSDVDIGVWPEPGQHLTAQDRLHLTIELEDLLEVNRVDLVVLPEASPFLAVDVIRGELLFCSDLDAQAEHELYILRRAGDLAHYERERWRQMILGEAL